MHWHSELELNYVVRGRGEFVCGGEKFTGEAGDLLILQPNVLHAARLCEGDGLLYCALVFSPAMPGAGVHDRCTTESVRPLINGEYKIGPFISAGADNFPRLRACAEQIFSCVRGGRAPGGSPAEKRAAALFLLLETDAGILRREEAGRQAGSLVKSFTVPPGRIVPFTVMICGAKYFGRSMALTSCSAASLPIPLAFCW